MTRPFHSSPDSNTEILDIYRAYMLELFFLANKANMCNPPLPYMELKELVDRSGEICKRWLRGRPKRGRKGSKLAWKDRAREACSSFPFPFISHASHAAGVDLGGGCRGCTPLPEMTYGFLIQLVFCKKCGLLVLVTPFLSGAPPPKKNPGSAPAYINMSCCLHGVSNTN